MVAHVLTNLDNMAIMMGMLFSVGSIRAAVGYLIAQAVVLSTAMGLAVGVFSGMPDRVGYLGVIPITLGLLTLWRNQGEKSRKEPNGQGQTHVLAIAAVFLALSFDSFSVMAPLLADSHMGFRWAALIGAIVASVITAFVAPVMGTFASGSVRHLLRLEKVAPYVMIGVGTYVVLNTATDIAGLSH